MRWGKKRLWWLQTADTLSLRREQRVTYDTSFIQPATFPLLCFISSLLFVCSRSAGEEVDLAGLDTNPLGFSLSTQRSSNLLSISASPTRCFQPHPLFLISPWYSHLRVPSSLLSLTAPLSSSQLELLISVKVDFLSLSNCLLALLPFPSLCLIIFAECSTFSLNFSQLLSGFHPLLSLLHLSSLRHSTLGRHTYATP